MTDSDTERFTATITVPNGGDDHTTFTVEADDYEHLDYTCPPGLDLTITSQHERITTTVKQGMDEDEAGALAFALLHAIEDGRAEAQQRGYYQWESEGKPEYGEPLQSTDCAPPPAAGQPSGLAGALTRVEAFVAGEEFTSLRVSDLALMVAALREVMRGGDSLEFQQQWTEEGQ